MKVILPPNMGMPRVDSFTQDFGGTETLLKNIFTVLKTFIYKDCAHRHGCYVAIFTRSSRKMDVQFHGDYALTENDKALKYLQCATEKVTRMARYHLENSFEQMDEANEKYGGGVGFNDELFIACSGFPPEIDEAVSYIIGLSKIDGGEALKAHAGQTGNAFVELIYTELKKLNESL